jgi:SAM-dependent methyltransferase
MGNAMSDSKASGRGRFAGEEMPPGLLTCPAAERNKEPILEVLERLLPSDGLVLEIASGTGQHVVHFAERLPVLRWQPSDPDAELLGAIRERLAAHPLTNVSDPVYLDVHERPWAVEATDAVVCINMIHVAPWSATQGLLEGAGELLARGAPLILYGPFKRGGAHTAESNAAFDESLKARNDAWGVRDLEQVTELAEAAGFRLERWIEMPANNLIIVYRRAA